jgi:hypothetical protein
MNNLAVVYTRQSRYDLSAPLLQQVLDTSRRLYGEEQRTTLNARINLAVADAGPGEVGRRRAAAPDERRGDAPRAR